MTKDKRGNDDEEDSQRKRSRTAGTQEDLRLDWVHDVRTKMNDEQECMHTMRDMERRGRPVAIAGGKGKVGDECKRKEAVSAEIIRNQVDGSKGYLHEVGNSEMSEHIEWNAKRGGKLYQVR